MRSATSGTTAGGAAAAAAGCLEASATSLHSSGQDSGIVARACHCSHSSSPSSSNSSKCVNGLEHRVADGDGGRIRINFGLVD